MSHVDTIEVEITDLNALRAAVKESGCLWLAKNTYEWYGHHVGDYPIPKGMTKEKLGQCDYVIQLPGCKYEIGVVKMPNGKWYRKLLSRASPSKVNPPKLVSSHRFLPIIGTGE